MLNQPYGIFFAIDLPGKAFNKFPNAHNFYGDFKDLDAANIQDVKTFFEHYYAANNAVLCVAGDVKPDKVFEEVEKYFGGISKRQVPSKPDVSEVPQTAERRATESDKFATVPALAIGYRMPPRKSHDAVVGAVVGELLHNGQASLLYQALVKGKQVALSVDGGANWPLGNPFEYDGPTLLTSFIVYPSKYKESDVVSAYDAVIASLATKGPTSVEMDRIRTKMRSDWYGQLEIPVERASVLSHATLFDGNPQRVNEIPDELAKVSPEEVEAFARKYLVSTNRTIIDRVPASAPGEKSEASGKGAQ
jgi:predicted Zn-dependent peptidase